ncbi:MAG TPA: nitroreductase/quinone reductase family protein [Anaerolineales bacterium]|nr:nitroreductase/quinone reductase family protein [Anaerolineales bacterium]
MSDELANPDRLRRAFRAFNRFMLLIFRLGLGSYGNRPELSQVMVITHTGRKTGLRRRTPVNYAVVDGEVYCLAGFGARTDWYRNLLADPQVEIWLPDGWYSGVAEDVSEDPRRLPLLRQVLIASGFAARAAGIDPRRITDEQLQAVSSDYRLVRIRRVQPRTGPGGPSDLAWVWPLSTLVLIGLLLIRRKRI